MNVLGGNTHLQGFRAVSQQFLDVPGGGCHQLLCIIGLHGEVRILLFIYLRQRGSGQSLM